MNHVELSRVSELMDIIHDASFLTESERARYESIKVSLRKGQFLAGHYLVRKIAGRVHSNAITDWSYHLDSNGFRYLSSRTLGLKYYVSISHAKDWVCAAISSHAIGIDIETYDQARDYLAIAESMFSEDEITTLKACEPDVCEKQFYLFWTLKEAAAKHSGAGIQRQITRSQVPKKVLDIALANLQSWECPEHVLSIKVHINARIDITGICANSTHSFWTLAA